VDDGADRAQLQRLVEHADIVVEDRGPERLEEHGLLPTELASAGSVVTRLSPFGQDGPLAHAPASELVLQAAGGWVRLPSRPGA
jgi:crotonobetainyl-CoA:carnitine CoA-transferase CaiB-like acyl-CoA transferase